MAVKKRIAVTEALRKAEIKLETEHNASAIEKTILALLHERNGRSFCPSEVARRLEPERWKPLMQPVRKIVARLALEGRLIVTQRGKDVDAMSARGPIRLNAVGIRRNLN